MGLVVPNTHASSQPTIAIFVVRVRMEASLGTRAVRLPMVVPRRTWNYETVVVSLCETNFLSRSERSTLFGPQVACAGFKVPPAAGGDRGGLLSRMGPQVVEIGPANAAADR